MKYVVTRVDAYDPEIEALLIRLQTDCLPGDQPLSPRDGDWWICYSEAGIPVAFCSIKPSLRWAETGYLSRAGVLPGHRGRGLQKRLIRVRVARARQLGWKWLYEPTYPYGLKTSVYWRRKI